MNYSCLSLWCHSLDKTKQINLRVFFFLFFFFCLLKVLPQCAEYTDSHLAVRQTLLVSRQAANQSHDFLSFPVGALSCLSKETLLVSSVLSRLGLREYDFLMNVCENRSTFILEGKAFFKRRE